MHIVSRTLCAAGFTLLTQGAFAAPCTATTVKGAWGFTYEGFNLAGQNYCAGVGLMTFNTANLSNNTVKISLQRESCDGGPVQAGTANGTYTVTSTCTGRSTNLVYVGGNGSARLDFNIVEAGKRLQFVMVIPNVITLHGEALKR
ncbi:MAG: hypothetical protein AB7I01_07900 [Gammaproteobacteria bacterium]